MFKKFKLFTKIWGYVNEVQKVIDKNRDKVDEAEVILNKAKDVSPEIKNIVLGIIGLFK